MAFDTSPSWKERIFCKVVFMSLFCHWFDSIRFTLEDAAGSDDMDFQPSWYGKSSSSISYYCTRQIRHIGVTVPIPLPLCSDVQMFYPNLRIAHVYTVRLPIRNTNSFSVNLNKFTAVTAGVGFPHSTMFSAGHTPVASHFVPTTHPHLQKAHSPRTFITWWLL